MSALAPGPEMDVAVCAGLLGWTNFRHRTNGCLIGKPLVGKSRVPLPVSTSDALAWEHVKERLRQMGFLVRVQEMPDNVPLIGGAGWRDEERVEIRRRAVCMLYWPDTTRPRPEWWPASGFTEFGDSTAEALCRVALQVVRAQDGGVR